LASNVKKYTKDMQAFKLKADKVSLQQKRQKALKTIHAVIVPQSQAACNSILQVNAVFLILN
jgi:hypothetical protein